MHPLSAWRILPPGGAPLPFTGILSGLAAIRNGNRAVAEFRDAVRQRFGAQFVFTTGSGRRALTMALTAMRWKNPSRDQALIPAYVSYSVPAAVAAAGCRVTLYDIDPQSLTPDWESMKKALTRRTLAVLACPLFGYPFDNAPGVTICRAHGIPLVDDAAQVMGREMEDRPAGRLGDVGIFSLSRGKPMTAVDGGILLTDDDSLARIIEEVISKAEPPLGALAAFVSPARALALSLLRHPWIFRLPSSLPWLRLGESVFDPYFSRKAFSPFQAGLALHALSRLDETNAGRARKAALYYQGLDGLEAVRAVQPARGTKPVYLRFPVLPGKEGASPRDLLQGKRGQVARRLGISRGFPLSVDRIPEAQPYLDPPVREYPGARHLAEHLVTLPTHDHVTAEDCAAALHFIRAAVLNADSGESAALTEGRRV